MLLGGQTLDVLQSWVEEKFSAVPGGLGPRPSVAQEVPPSSTPPISTALWLPWSLSPSRGDVGSSLPSPLTPSSYLKSSWYPICLPFPLSFLSVMGSSRS